MRVRAVRVVRSRGLGDRCRGGDGEADERGDDDGGTHLDDLEVRLGLVERLKFSECFGANEVCGSKRIP